MFLHDTPSWCITIPSLVTKVWAVQHHPHKAQTEVQTHIYTHSVSCIPYQTSLWVADGVKFTEYLHNIFCPSLLAPTKWRENSSFVLVDAVWYAVVWYTKNIKQKHVKSQLTWNPIHPKHWQRWHFLGQEKKRCSSPLLHPQCKSSHMTA